MNNKLTDEEVITIAAAIDILRELREREEFLDTKTYSLLYELRYILELFEL